MTNTTTPNLLYTANSGSSSSNPFVDVFESRDPTVNDTNYPIRKKWLNTSNGNYWILYTFTSFGGVLQAAWLQIGNTAVTVETLTGNTGGAVGPTADNIDVIGDGTYIKVVGNPSTSTITIEPAGGLTETYVTNSGTASASAGSLSVLGTQGISTTGSGHTVTTIGQPAVAASSSSLSNLGVASFNNADFTVDGNGFVSFSANAPYYSLTPYIVGSDVHSQYSTIQGAINAAVTAGASSSSPANIYIKGGVYTENLTGADGINLIGFGFPSTKIIGKISFATAGGFTVSGVLLQTNEDFLLSVSGSSVSTVNLENCYINCTNNTGIQFSNSNATSSITVDGCYGNVTTTGIAFFVSTSPGAFSITDSSIGNTGGSTTYNTTSLGNVGINSSDFFIPFESTGTGSISSEFCFVSSSVINVIQNSTVASQITHTTFICADSCVSIGVGGTLQLYNCVFESSATHAITGAGTVIYAGLTVTGGDINTSTILKNNFYAGNVL